MKAILEAHNAAAEFFPITLVYRGNDFHDWFYLHLLEEVDCVDAENTKFDRLFSSVADAAQSIADFDRKDIELVSIAEAFDMTSPYGLAMAQMASVFAELERAMIRERTKAAMNVKRGRNERMSHKIPYGWDEGAQGILLWTTGHRLDEALA